MGEQGQKTRMIGDGEKGEERKGDRRERQKKEKTISKQEKHREMMMIAAYGVQSLALWRRKEKTWARVAANCGHNDRDKEKDTRP